MDIQINADKQKQIDHFRKDYLGKGDLRETGFGGTEKEWEFCRSIIVDVIDHDGRFLDVGCANGRLAYDVQRWASERNIKLDVYGVDFVHELIQKAKSRFPGKEDHFFVSDAFKFSPPTFYEFILIAVRLQKDQQEILIRHFFQMVSGTGKLIVTKYDDSTGHEFEEFSQFITSLNLGNTSFVHNGCTCLGVIQKSSN